MLKKFVFLFLITSLTLSACSSSDVLQDTESQALEEFHDPYTNGYYDNTRYIKQADGSLYIDWDKNMAPKLDVIYDKNDYTDEAWDALCGEFYSRKVYVNSEYDKLFGNTFGYLIHDNALNYSIPVILDDSIFKLEIDTDTEWLYVKDWGSVSRGSSLCLGYLLTNLDYKLFTVELMKTEDLVLLLEEGEFLPATESNGWYIYMDDLYNIIIEQSISFDYSVVAKVFLEDDSSYHLGFTEASILAESTAKAITLSTDKFDNPLDCYDLSVENTLYPLKQWYDFKPFDFCYVNSWKAYDEDLDGNYDYNRIHLKDVETGESYIVKEYNSQDLDYYVKNINYRPVEYERVYYGDLPLYIGYKNSVGIVDSSDNGKFAEFAFQSGALLYVVDYYGTPTYGDSAVDKAFEILEKITDVRD